MISCTWYVGSEAQYAGSTAFLQEYYGEFVSRGLPFRMDEIGGSGGEGIGQNDAFLARMFGELAALAPRGIAFEYVTVWLEGKWGADATLAFLRRPGDSWAPYIPGSGSPSSGRDRLSTTETLGEKHE